MKTSKNTAALVGSLLLGTLIGGAIGLLFAPAKGKKTRKMLLRKGEDMADDLKDKANDLMVTIKNEAEEAKTKVKEYIQNGSATAHSSK